MRRNLLAAMVMVSMTLLNASYLQAAETIPVKVVLNTVDKGEAFVLLTPKGDILLSKEQLTELGFRTVPEKARIPRKGFISLSSLAPDVTFELRTQEAALLITAAPGLLEKTDMDLSYKRPENVIYPKESSAFLNYAVDFSMGDKFSFQALSMPSEVGIRIGDYLLYSNFEYTKTDTDERFVRLITNITRDDRENVRRYTIGDFYAFSGPLGGAGTFGGVSISKNYSINPYFVHYPSLDLSGFLQTPSEVELLVNNVSMRKEKLPPGQYDITNFYPHTGAGDAVVVVRDAFGREERTITPFYLSSSLLMSGLHDYSYNFGFRRSDLGIESFKYSEPTFLAYHRYGFNETFTGGLSAEIDKDVVNLAPGVSFIVDRSGEVDAALAGSRSKGKYGYGLFASYTYSDNSLSGNASFRYFSKDYENISSEISDEKPRFEGIIEAGFNAGMPGSISASFQYISKYGEKARKIISASYSRTLCNGVTLSTTASRTEQEGATYEIFGGLTFVLGRNHFGTLNFRSAGSERSVIAGLQKNPPRGEGLSYGISSEIDKDDRWRLGGRTYLQYKGPYGIYSAGLRRTAGVNIYDLTMAGGLVFVDNSFHLSRPVTDSFGLVKIDDAEGVRVYSGNEEVAVTNKKGEAIIPDLTSYNDNKISFEPSDMPVNYELADLEKYVSPSYRSGSTITFGVRKIQAFEGRIYVVEKGERKPASFAGLQVAVNKRHMKTVIGKGGEFYIENLKAGRFAARVLLAGGRHCDFELTVPESTEIIVPMGDIICEIP